MSTLTAKRQRFADEYAVDRNATQAAIRAGYSEHTARAQGSRLLTDVAIRSYLQTLEDERAEKVELTAEFVLNGLMTIATQGRGSPQVRALELLGKHLALFTDRLEVTQVPDRTLVQGWIEALTADVQSNP